MTDYWMQQYVYTPHDKTEDCLKAAFLDAQRRQKHKRTWQRVRTIELWLIIIAVIGTVTVLGLEVIDFLQQLVITIKQGVLL